jgi:hypothetical protein
MVATLFPSLEALLKAALAECPNQFSVLQREDGWLFSRPEKYVKIFKIV